MIKIADKYKIGPDQDVPEVCILEHGLNFGYASPYDEYCWDPNKAYQKLKIGALLCATDNSKCCLGVTIKCHVYKAFTRDVFSQPSDLLVAKEANRYISAELITNNNVVEAFIEVLEITSMWYKASLDPNKLWVQEAKYIEQLAKKDNIPFIYK